MHVGHALLGCPATRRNEVHSIRSQRLLDRVPDAQAAAGQYSCLLNSERPEVRHVSPWNDQRMANSGWRVRKKSQPPRLTMQQVY
jgi:hypothetical protein